MFDRDDEMPPCPLAHHAEGRKLIDVTAHAREIGFLVPVAITDAAWHRSVGVVDGVPRREDSDRLRHALAACRHALAKSRAERRRFSFPLRGRHPTLGGGAVYLAVEFCPDDEGRPGLTVQLPGEG